MFGGGPEPVKVSNVKRVENQSEILRHEEERVRWFGFPRCDPRENDVPRDSDAHCLISQLQESEAETDSDGPSQPVSSLTLARMDSA